MFLNKIFFQVRQTLTIELAKKNRIAAVFFLPKMLQRLHVCYWHQYIVNIRLAKPVLQVGN